MAVFKGLLSGFFSFLLFICLIALGITYWAHSTLLSSAFIEQEISRVDVSEIAADYIDELFTDNPSAELKAMIIETIDSMETAVKEQIGDAADSTYDYLLGKKDNPELNLTLRNTFLSSEFLVSVLSGLDLATLTEELVDFGESGGGAPIDLDALIAEVIPEVETVLIEGLPEILDPVFDYLTGVTSNLDLGLTIKNADLTESLLITLLDNIDFSPLLDEMIGDLLSGELPPDFAFLADEFDTLIVQMESQVKQELENAIGPVIDYILGYRPTTGVSINLLPVIQGMEDTLRDAFFNNIPPAYQGHTPAQLNQIFDQIFNDLTAAIPTGFSLDDIFTETGLNTQISQGLASAEDALTDMRATIATGITGAEEGLETARQYVGYFQTGYYILIGVVIALMLILILLNLRVKDATRVLGILFTIYGAIELAGVLVAKSIGAQQLAKVDLPSPVDILAPQLLSDVLAPLQAFSIGFLVGGVILIVVSIIYPRWRQSEASAVE